MIPRWFIEVSSGFWMTVIACWVVGSSIFTASVIFHSIRMACQ